MHAVWSTEASRAAIADEQRHARELAGARALLLATLRRRASPFGSYRCEQCGGEFEKTVSDATAEAEAFELFGVARASTSPAMGIVCDVCFLQAVARW
jgi:predicted restriction endonuclease